MDDMERVGLLRRKPLVQPLSMQKKKKEREGEGMILRVDGVQCERCRWAWGLIGGEER